MEKFEIIKEDELSGEHCNIYSIKMDGEKDTLFEKFLDNNYDTFENEVNDIYNRLAVIGSELGLRECFYKPNEGKPGDGICALYDKPGSKLRLYFIRYGSNLIILGDGGEKPKNIGAWQESTMLEVKVNLLHEISKAVTHAIKERDIKITNNGFEGELSINPEDF